MPRQFNLSFESYINSQENSQIARLYWVHTLSGISYTLTDWVFPVKATVPHPTTESPTLTTFTPHQGFDATAFADEARPVVTNAEFSSYFQLEGISAEEIYAGLFSGAIVSVFLFLPDRPDVPAELIYQGEVGEVNEIGIDKFRMEFRGTAQALQQKIGLTVSESCPWSFSDGIKCRANAIQEAGVITIVNSPRELTVEFSTSLNITDNFWQSGVLVYEGSNLKYRNYRIEVSSCLALSPTLSRIVFFYPLPFPAIVGDSVGCLTGCRKTIEDCQNRYNNIADFGGFPHLPGRDKLLVGRG